MNKKINSFVNNIWNKEAKKQLENEISFCLKEKIELPDGKDYLKMYEETHKTDEQIIEDLQQELEKHKNIIDELENFILNHYIVGHKVQNASLDDILNKLKELKGSDE